MSMTLASVRAGVFRVVTCLAVAEIAIGAVLISNTASKFNFYFTFDALGVAAAAMTVLTIPVMLWVSNNRTGSVITTISAEAAWTFILWVLWLAAAADTAKQLPDNICLIVFSDHIFELEFLNDPSLCPENRAFTALAFMEWAFLFFYNITLVVLAVRLENQGHNNVWSRQVLETDFSAPAPNTSAIVYPSEAKGVVVAVPQPGLAVPVPAMNTQSDGYVPQHGVGALNVAQLTGTTATSSHLPEV